MNFIKNCVILFLFPLSLCAMELPEQYNNDDLSSVIDGLCDLDDLDITQLTEVDSWINYPESNNSNENAHDVATNTNKFSLSAEDKKFLYRLQLAMIGIVLPQKRANEETTNEQTTNKKRKITKPFRCGCRKLFALEVERQTCLATHKYLCTFCSARFSTVSDRDACLKSHFSNGDTNQELFYRNAIKRLAVCNICENEFTSLGLLKKHRKAVHITSGSDEPVANARKFTCHCHNKYFTAADRDACLKTHLFLCVVCEKRFAIRAERAVCLNNHLKTMNWQEQQSYKAQHNRLVYCPDCGIEHASKSSVKDHAQSLHKHKLSAKNILTAKLNTKD